MSSPLQSPRVRRILAAYTVNRLGTWFGVIALMVAVFDRTHSAVAVAALLLGAQALPAFVVPALVVRVEASSGRSELSALYFFEAVATVALAVLLFHFWLPAIILLAALDGTAALAANALLRSELARAARDQVESHGEGSPAVTEERAQEAERRANAALNVGFSVSMILGPVLAGIVVAAAGAPAALYIDVASFVICGLFLLDLHPHVEAAEGDSVRARLRSGWQHINEAPPLRGVLLAYGIALVFLYSAAPIELTYAKATLHAGDRGFGTLLTVWGSGAVVGSVVFARSLHRSLGVLLGLGVSAIGIAYVGYWAAPSLGIACIAALLGGLGNSLELPSSVSLVQQLTPQRLQGRMMGAVESLNALGLALGLPLGGALVALSTPRVAFLVVGLGSMATSVAFFRIRLSRAAPSNEDTHAGLTPSGRGATRAPTASYEPLPPETASH